MIRRRQLESTDIERIDHLVHDYRLATTTQAHLTTWRVRLLLSSRVWDSEKDAAIWEEPSEGLLAFAMLWSRSPDDENLILEYIVQPRHCKVDLLNGVIGWAVACGRDRAQEGGRTLRIHGAEHLLHSCPQVDFRGLGFAEFKRDPDRHAVFFERVLDEPVPPVNLPPGYAAHEIATAEGLNEYEQLYDFATVSDKFRQYALISDEYTHLVILDPKGSYAAYCEYSISKDEWARESDRIAWIHYIGTKEAERGKGLAASILVKALANLRRLGAASAMLVTTTDNSPAIRLYEKTGFRPIAAERQRHYWMEFRP